MRKVPEMELIMQKTLELRPDQTKRTAMRVKKKMKVKRATTALKKGTSHKGQLGVEDDDEDENDGSVEEDAESGEESGAENGDGSDNENEESGEESDEDRDEDEEADLNEAQGSGIAGGSNRKSDMEVIVIDDEGRDDESPKKRKEKRSVFSDDECEEVPLSEPSTPLDTLPSGRQRVTDPDFTSTIEERREYDEGTVNNIQASDFDGEHDPMLQSLLALRARQERNAPSSPSATRRPGIPSEPICNIDGTVVVKTNWENYILCLDDTYLFSNEARMLVAGSRIELVTGGGRASSYKGLKVHENNNLDVRYAFRYDFGGVLSPNYASFRGFVGQVLRAAIAMGKIEKQEAWKEGQLFRLAPNVSFWELIIGFFEEKAMGGTIKHKAQMATKIISLARRYFRARPLYGDNQAENSRMEGKMQEALCLVRKKCRIGVKLARTASLFKKEDEERIANKRYLTEEDITAFRQDTFKSLWSVMRTFQHRCLNNGAIDNAKFRLSAQFHVYRAKTLCLPMKWVF